VIVVGDEMQLPPTSFFSSAGDGDADTLTVEDDGERVAVALDADSLLNQGARNLPATLLAWHYRSRYESLIGFSNAAFYAGNLYTVPDRGVPSGERDALAVQVADLDQQGVVAQADALLGRPISFHAVTGAVYAARSNEGEARYIAHLVRELLNRETGLSIGVVAFSEAQQGTVESALAALSAEDPAFGARLEAEYTREEDDQFCGLFVKNLENVQGDERDVIILSICYAPGADGRMLMNFGPINQRGGEKRLNVIFSRARHHMAVVSTIRSEAITNDHNDGASALKQFLRYAESASRGDVATAQRVLEGLNPLARRALTRQDGADAVVAALARALRDRGHQVDEHIGQSRFRCDLGVRDAHGGPHYTLAIQVDTAAQYGNPDVFERYVSRPRILRTFGWRTVQVLARDWHQDPSAVIDAVERALREDVRTEAPDLPAVPEVPTEPPVPVARLEPELETAPVGAAGARRLVFTEGTSRKFWQVAREGVDLTITWGRLGTQGQVQVKTFGTEARAQAELDKLVAEKLRKGYADGGADAAG
jgi:predicted DNA-binding WGR domain protein